MKLLVFVLSFLSVSVLWAQEKTNNETKTEGTDEADQVITNRRLRATEGSLSKWSVSTYWNYQGGSMSDPTDPERPNIVSGGNVETLQSLSGEVVVNFRLT